MRFAIITTVISNKSCFIVRKIGDALSCAAFQIFLLFFFAPSAQASLIFNPAGHFEAFLGNAGVVLFGFQHIGGESYFRDLASIGVNFKEVHYQSTMGLYVQTFNGHAEGALTSSELGVIFSAAFEFWQKDH